MIMLLVMGEAKIGHVIGKANHVTSRPTHLINALHICTFQFQIQCSLENMSLKGNLCDIRG